MQCLSNTYSLVEYLLSDSFRQHINRFVQFIKPNEYYKKFKSENNFFIFTEPMRQKVKLPMNYQLYCVKYGVMNIGIYPVKIFAELSENFINYFVEWLNKIHMNF